MGDTGEGGRGARDVAVEDPGLSPQANDALTAEARKALGAKRVPARGEETGPARLPGGRDGTLTAVIAHNRLIIGLAFSVLMVVGIIVSLATDRWIFLGVAVFAHAAVTALWALFAIRLAGEPEHADPEVAAMLEEEGVSDPDARLGEIVSDFRGEDADPAHTASEPATSVEESAPSFMILLPAAGLLAVSALAPFVTDGRNLWLLPVILWPLVIGTLLFAWRRPEGASSAVADHPRAFAAALAFGALGIVVLLVGVALG